MLRTWKFVLTCLLALALPLQGVAAATMAHCASSHERMHAAASGQGEHAHHAQHAQHAAQGHHDHHAAAAADPEHTAQAGAADTSDAPLSDLAQYQCSACGACCAAAVLPAPALDVPAPLPAVTWTYQRLPLHFVFVTDGPERPPRSARA